MPAAGTTGEQKTIVVGYDGTVPAPHALKRTGLADEVVRGERTRPAAFEESM